MIYRTITSSIQKAAQQFPVIGITGPWDSGKTTLVKGIFTHYSYITLEDLDTKLRVKEDPRKFFASFAHASGLIIDEAQEVPELFSYLQGIVDQNNRPGFFVLTGSQNFLMHERITQTLAGRIALFTLLPLSIAELNSSAVSVDTSEIIMQRGLYPRIYAQNIDQEMWFANYITTYVERDVRQIINIGDILSFQKLLKLCAARTGNIINYASLAHDCDISPIRLKHGSRYLRQVISSNYYRLIIINGSLKAQNCIFAIPDLSVFYL